MNFQQLEALWIQQNPGQAAYAPIMAAIAMAESSGNPSNVNWSDPLGSYGLWQVNHYWNPQFSLSSLYDPNYNATAAGQILGSQGLGAWSTWKSYVAGSGHGFDVISGLLGPYNPANVPAGSSYAGGTASTSGSGYQGGPAQPGSFAAAVAPPAGAKQQSWLDAIGSVPIIGKMDEAIVSNAVVALFALVSLAIGGAWLIFGTKPGQTVVTAGKKVASTATKAAAIAA